MRTQHIRTCIVTALLCAVNIPSFSVRIGTHAAQRLTSWTQDIRPSSASHST